MSAEERLADALRAVDWASIRQINDKSPEAEAAYQTAYAAYRAIYAALQENHT